MRASIYATHLCIVNAHQNHIAARMTARSVTHVFIHFLLLKSGEKATEALSALYFWAKPTERLDTALYSGH